MSERKPAPLLSLRDGPSGRRRSAPRAEETSDVARFRGFAIAIAVAVVAALAHARRQHRSVGAALAGAAVATAPAGGARVRARATRGAGGPGLRALPRGASVDAARRTAD